MPRSLYALTDDAGQTFDVHHSLCPFQAHNDEDGQEAQRRAVEATAGTWDWLPVCTVAEALAAREMREALECVAALEMDREDGEAVLRKHGIPNLDPNESNPREYEKTVRAWISRKVAAALIKAEEG